ncbi:MAG: HIT family protein [Actinobacteria bacterium]|nr:HIT family protein [Actinomycetota bacterium]
MSCTFCSIVAGELDARTVWESEHCLAFLDRRPVFPGHTLVVPKEHVDTLVELPDRLLTPLMGDARLLAAAMKQGLHAHGTFVAINNEVSQSVPHIHVHVVPRRFKDGLRGFFWPRQRYEDEAHEKQVQEAIARAAGSLAQSQKAPVQ